MPARTARGETVSLPLEFRLPALEIRQGERQLYQFAIDGKRLPEVTTVSRIHRDDAGRIGGYQRPEVLRHVKAIRSYLESPGALMPNALVVAFDTRVRFEPVGDAPADADTRVGLLIIPIDPSLSEHDKPGWVVDGQQRSAAIRDADVDRFPIPVVGFITDDLSEQRAQFILVNSTRPLPKGLIHELLPSTEGHLPAMLARKRYPAKLVEALNYVPGSPMQGAIRTTTTPTGRIKDNSVLKMLENSITDGALYRFRDPATGEGDSSKMLETLWNFWWAVRRTWPEAWALTPRKSRLVHGVGIVALGFVMDDITDRFSSGETVPSVATFEAELQSLVDVCAWTHGFWDYGLRERRAWNALQVTPRDIAELTDYLLRRYRTVAGAAGEEPTVARAPVAALRAIV
jgi:DGQHR domain-containing protein